MSALDTTATVRYAQVRRFHLFRSDIALIQRCANGAVIVEEEPFDYR